MRLIRKRLITVQHCDELHILLWEAHYRTPAGTRGDVSRGQMTAVALPAGGSRVVEPRDSCCKMTRSARVIGRGEVTSISLSSGLWRVHWRACPISGHFRHINPTLIKQKGVASPYYLGRLCNLVPRVG